VIIILRYVCLSFKRHARIMTHGSPRPRERERERKERERARASERARGYSMTGESKASPATEESERFY
jgi:hypothetical protein